jgi:hypothetical protein
MIGWIVFVIMISAILGSFMKQDPLPAKDD